MTTKQGIGIFKAVEKPIGFFEVGSDAVFASLLEGVAKLLGEGVSLTEPTEEGSVAKRVGEVQIRIVEDDDKYVVKAQKTKKETTERSPDGETGAWEVQSLIFSKENYTEEECKTWIKDQDGVGDYGIDETDSSYKFRQYDPKHFSEFKTVSLSPGVSGIYGKIAGEAVDEEEAEKALNESLKTHEAVQTLNKMVAKKLKVLPSTCRVNKAEDAEGGVEERFVMSLVLEPNDGIDGELNPDTQDDVYSSDTIRKTAHQWMEFHGSLDLMHNWQAIGKENVRVLETFIAPCDFTLSEQTVAKGSWMLAIRIVNDDLWDAVKSGDIGAYSIGGTATRTPVKED